MQSNKKEKKDNTITQYLSALVRARLLFKREIEIDRGGATSKFDEPYLARVIEIKKLIDLQMQKLIASATGTTLLVYLVGKGMDPSVPIWGLKLTNVPGILIFLTLFANYATAMAGVAFFNSQTYAALIDQVILDDANNGLLDVDMIKASRESEWLIFKALRRDFSFYSSVHIEFDTLGKTISTLSFVLLVLIAIVPFFGLITALPYLTITMLPNDVFGLLAKFFSVSCTLAVALLFVISNFSFSCQVTLEKPKPTGS